MVLVVVVVSVVWFNKEQNKKNNQTNRNTTTNSRNRTGSATNANALVASPTKHKTHKQQPKGSCGVRVGSEVVSEYLYR